MRMWVIFMDVEKTNQTDHYYTCSVVTQVLAPHSPVKWNVEDSNNSDGGRGEMRKFQVCWTFIEALLFKPT